MVQGYCDRLDSGVVDPCHPVRIQHNVVNDIGRGHGHILLYESGGSK